MTCLSAYMYRQISKCTDKTLKKHYWGGGQLPPPPPSGYANGWVQRTRERGTGVHDIELYRDLSSHDDASVQIFKYVRLPVESAHCTFSHTVREDCSGVSAMKVVSVLQTRSSRVLVFNYHNIICMIIDSINNYRRFEPWKNIKSAYRLWEI